MKSLEKDAAAALFEQLATSREPFTMVLCRTPPIKPDGTLALHARGVLGIVTRHEARDDTGEVFTDLMGMGRVVLGSPYLLVDEMLPRVDVTRCVPTDDAQRDALQQALEALVEEFCAPLLDARPELAHTLTRFAREHDDVGVNLDRVTTAIVGHDARHIQRFIDEDSLIARMHMLQEAMLHQLKQGRST